MLVVSSVVLDLNWVFQFIATSFLVLLCFSLFLVKTTFFTNYFSTMMVPHEHEQEHEKVDFCVVCRKASKKQCSACKLVKYCSAACQRSHWNSGHKTECKKFQLGGICNLKQSTSVQNGQKRTVSLVAGGVLSSNIKRPKEMLFPYEDFIELYNWDDAKFPPCGLLNCGNSCFANAVLQCLSHTRPLVAYLLEKNHRKECRKNDWCFLCEFQTHIERASSSRQPFSPLNILSRLPNIGSNFGYGKQEDAHEFMRFAIDTMQSVFLDEFGGEKVLHPRTQETTLIQHIFGGHLQSQVVCSVCRNVSNQCENVMDLTVEINGDATSLEECLDQFTAREQLHGDNLYKCDGCNDYVMAWKRLMIRRAPNILTIALKRFQSGRFGKLNKKVTFPETLDLTPYMTEERDGNDIYKLYAVVVHVDMLNASFFGHYICYTKDFCGNWYRIDDCKVSKVDLQDVLSEGAYMLLYNRISPRPSCLKPIGSSSKEQQTVKVVQEEEQSVEVQSVESLARAESSHSFSTSGSIEVQPNDSVETDLLSKKSVSKDVEMADFISSPSSSEDMDVSSCQYSKPENEIASSSLCTEIENQQRVGISDNVLICSSTENLQCTEDSDRVESDQNHDDSSCRDFIANPSSPQDMDVSSCHDIEPEKEITSSSLRSEAGNLPKVEISNDVLMCSSTENLQSSGDSDIIESEQNHGSSNKLSQSVDFKREQDKMETEKGFPLSSGGKVAVRKSVNGKNLKPFLTPGFLGNNASKNSMKRCEKGPYNGGDSSHQEENASSSLRTEVGNLQKVEISNDLLMCSSTENSQCSEDGDRVESGQNHGSSNK